MFEIRRLGPEDLGLILEMQQRIYSSLQDKSVFQRSTSEFITYCLGEGGRCYSVQHRGDTIVYRIVYFPRDRAFNLAKDIPLPPDEQARVAHWDTIAVLPKWRGFGLSRLMNTHALSDLANTEIRHLFATSSPQNPYGIRSLIETGFRPIRLILKFGGKLRLLFYRPYPADWCLANAHMTEKEVPLSATADLEAAFQNGWIGTGIKIDKAAPRLRMQHHPILFDY